MKTLRVLSTFTKKFTGALHLFARVAGRGPVWVALFLGLAATGKGSASDDKFHLLHSDQRVTPQIADVFAEIADSEYNIAWQPSAAAYQAPNREQNLRFTYAANGFSVKRRVTHGTADAWSVGFELKSYGRKNPVDARAQAEYQTDRHNVRVITKDVTFGYNNSSTGMEQTFTIAHKPRRGRLSLDLALNMRGLNLEVRNNSAFFQDSTTRAVVMAYNNLKVWDASGRLLSARMRQTGSARMAIDVDDSAAQYPVVVDPTIIAVIQGYEDGDQFGFSVAYTGAYVEAVFDGGYQFGGVLIGAPWYDAGLPGQGAAWIYARVDGTRSGNWTYAPLINDGSWTGTQANENFGYSVAVAYQYMTPNCFWTLRPAINTSNQVVFPGIIIGAPNFSANGLSQCGAAFVYYCRCGSSIAPGFDGCTNEPYPATPDWATFGPQSSCGYGFSVASSGKMNADFQTVVVGAPFLTSTNSSNAVVHGAVFLYPGSYYGLSTTPEIELTGSSSPNDNFGWSVACAGDVDGDNLDDLIVGAPGRQRSGFGAPGAALIYTANSLIVQGSTAPQYTLWGNQDGEQFGYSVCSGIGIFNTGSPDIAVGAPSCVVGGSSCGAVYAYEGALQPGDVTSATAILSPPNRQGLCQFGASLATSTIADLDDDSDPWSGVDDPISTWLIVGAPVFSSYDGGYKAGAIFLYSAGLANAPEEQDGNGALAYFGWSVSGMTPFDNGFFVGSPGYSPDYGAPGTVSVVYPGGPGGGLN